MSLILVVHREQGWLPELAASVLAQESADFELLAIDDASPDHAPAMLDELAERDARVRVRHLHTRMGLAEGRNLGLELAEGDHVWFIETTDLLPPGALAAVGRRLHERAPEVLLVHFSWADVLGRSRPGPHGQLLTRLEAGEPRPIDEHPAIALAAPEVWDKVFSRELLRVRALRFRAGALSLSWPALLAAERIDGLAAESYVRRRPPNAVPHETPFDVFEQYDAVFDFAAPDARRRLVLPSMVRHELALLPRVPESVRERFFAQMSDAVRRHRRGDEAPLGSCSLELRARLVERGDWRAYRALDEAIALRRRVNPAQARATVRRVKRAVRPRRRSLQAHYRARLREPIDPDLAVFAAYWYRGYHCNPRAIYEKARELVRGFRGVWVVSTDGASTIPDGVDYVMAGGREYYDVIARARWFVNNVNFPNNFAKREGTVHVMTHHGTPLKHMGLDVKPERVAALLRRCSRWDFSVSQNAFTTPIWERVYPASYESLEVGYPRNDVLANADSDDVARVRTELGIEPDRRAVLYTPTHREYHDDYVPMLDLAELSAGLGPEWVVLARAHYFYDGFGEAGGRVRDVSAHPSIEELCLAADVLVTDYSSIMFDYAVLDRPIVIHAPDWDEYRTRRGVYFDVTTDGPGVVTRSDTELVDALRSGRAFDEEANALRASFRARFCYLDDGRAAERVVRRVWFREHDVVTAAEAAVAG